MKAAKEDENAAEDAKEADEKIVKYEDKEAAAKSVELPMEEATKDVEGAKKAEGSNNGGSVQVDSTIVGIRGQSFKSEGQGAVWYVNLAVESLLWNMKFQYFSSFLKDENNCVTVISIQIQESRGLVQNVIIRVREEDRFFLGCSDGDGSLCIGGVSFQIIVNVNTQRSSWGYFASPNNGNYGLRVIALQKVWCLTSNVA